MRSMNSGPSSARRRKTTGVMDSHWTGIFLAELPLSRGTQSRNRWSWIRLFLRMGDEVHQFFDVAFNQLANRSIGGGGGGLFVE